MAKLSDTAVLILLMIDSPHVNVSWYGDWHRETWMASPARGHGTKANPRASVGRKLINEGLITDAPAHRELTLTPEGREELIKYRTEGWSLVTGVGHPPRVVKPAA